MRVLLQLILCIVVLAAGAAGFVALKTGKNPVDVVKAQRADSPASTDDSASKEPDDSSSSSQSDVEPEATDEAVPVNVLIASKQSHAPRIDLYGTVETPRETRLTAAINADVVVVNALEGQQIAKGATLVELDGRDISLNITQLKAERAEIQANAAAQRRRHQANVEALESEQEILELSQQQYERYAKLATRQIGTRASADDAARVVKQQELAITNRRNAIDDHTTTMAGIDARASRVDAQIEQAERDLGRTRILAPFDGKITSVAASPGNRVRAGDALITLYDTEFVEVRAQIPNRYVEQIRQSLSTGGDLTGTGRMEGRSFDVRLDRLAAKSRSGSGGVDALVRVTDNNPPGLGRTINLSMRLPAVNDSFAIPATAINDIGDVYVVRDNKLASVAITRVGNTRVDGESVLLVTSDSLRDGDAVVISQIPSASEGLLVEITNQP